MTNQDYGLARRMWHQLEPIHAMFWYAPEVFAEAAGLGYDVQTRWPSYFAWRLAPLDTAGPRLAASACYSFSPDFVAAHVPAAWTVASPERILAARERAVDRMYQAPAGGSRPKARPRSAAGTAGTRSNGAPTGSPTPPDRRSAPTGQRGSLS